jgi:8-oxo-dGTP pyrophosphatase MutT (NUDIX family)
VTEVNPNQEPTADEIAAILDARAPLRIDPAGFKIAAVLLPLVQKDRRWHVILTKRTDTVEHHKGEISFPGGHKDDEDHDLVHTALRETFEEIGVPPEKIRILGRLDDIPTITGFRVRPFVGAVEWPLEIQTEPHEIAQVLILPIADFLDPARFERREISHGGRPYPVYFFRFDGFTVWGATAKMLKQFLEVAMGFKEPGG